MQGAIPGNECGFQINEPILSLVAMENRFEPSTRSARLQEGPYAWSDSHSSGFACYRFGCAVFGRGRKIHLSIDVSKPGPTINRNIFGQFAENLGHGLYEGIWVGPDSPIPNTRGIRNDVVSALRDLKVPNVRWPGGCFADQYHWRKGIGPREKRPATVNSAWGDVIDTNAFGTDEFMDFIQQIGSTPYVSINIGSGTPETRRL